jgi:hypothetical protein
VLTITEKPSTPSPPSYLNCRNRLHKHNALMSNSKCQMNQMKQNACIPALLCAQTSTRVRSSDLGFLRSKPSASVRSSHATLLCSQQLTMPQMSCVFPVPGGPCTRWNGAGFLPPPMPFGGPYHGVQLRIACTRMHAVAVDVFFTSTLRCDYM